MNPLLIAWMQPGGLLTTTTVVENFPGFNKGVDGLQLMTEMQEQATRFGTRVESTDLSCRPFTLTVEGEKIQRAAS